MSNNLQVTFDSTKWTAGSGSGTTQGCNGYNAGGVFADLDGVTAWAFEQGASGFARFNILTGNILLQDVAFGTENSINWNAAPNGVVMFGQDSSNHYYMVAGTTLYKVHIGSGTTGTILNGNEVVDATFDLTTLTLYYGDSMVPTNMAVFNSGGTNYVAVSTLHTAYLFDADTFTFLGYNYFGASQITIIGMYASTVDGNLWMLFWNANYSFGNKGYFCAEFWNSTLGIDSENGQMICEIVVNEYPQYNSYDQANECLDFRNVPPNAGIVVPSAKGIILAATNTNTCDTCVLDFYSNAILARTMDDLMFMQGTQSLYYAAAAGERSFYYNGATSLGLVMFEGSNGSTTQSGGILRIVDPPTFTTLLTIDITGTINADVTLTPVPSVSLTKGQYILITSATEDSGNQLTLAGANNLSTGATPTFANCLSASSWLNAITAGQIIVSSTDGTPEAICSDTTSHGAFGPQSENAPPNPFSLTDPAWYPILPAYGVASATMTPSLNSFAWSITNDRVLATYNAGSPVYIIPTFPGQLTEVALTATANPAQYGSNVMVSAAVTGAISGFPTTGTVTFFDTFTPTVGSPQAVTIIGAINVDGTGVSNYTFSLPGIGSHVLQAVFSGGNNGSTLYAPSESTMITLVVNQANTVTTITSATPSSINPNETVNVTVNVATQLGGIPSEGQVWLYLGGIPFGEPVTVDGSGNATFAVNTIFVAGANALTAGYDDNNNFGLGIYGGGFTWNDNNYYNPSTSSTTTITVVANIPTSLTLTSTKNPSQFEDQITYRVSVTAESGPTPSGTVTLICNNGGNITTLGVLTLDGSGNATLTTDATPVGRNTITATYTYGTPDFNLPVDVIQTVGFASDVGGYQLSLNFPNRTQDGSLVLAHQYADGFWNNVD